jgi:hypothetical protein
MVVAVANAVKAEEPEALREFLRCQEERSEPCTRSLGAMKFYKHWTGS